MDTLVRSSILVGGKKNRQKNIIWHPPLHSGVRNGSRPHTIPAQAQVSKKTKLIHEEGWRIQGNFSSDRREIAPDETGTPVRNSILVGEKDPFFITALGAKNFDGHPIFGISEFGVSGPAEGMNTPNPHQSEMKKWISSHPARTGKLRREVRIHGWVPAPTPTRENPWITRVGGRNSPLLLF